MRYRWVHIGCDVADEQMLAGCWAELQAGLDARLEMLAQPPDDAAVVVTHDRDENPAWDVLVVLTSPARSVTGDARAETPQAALEQAVRRLLLGIDKLDRSDGAVEQGRRRRGMKEIVPHLHEARKRSNMSAFAALLYPVLRGLRRHAARELAVREIEETLLEGEWDVDELVNETLLLAWENFEKRPDSVPLPAWLMGLFGQVLETAARQTRDEVLLSGSLPPARRVPLDEEASEDQWVEEPDEAEELTLADLLPGEPGLDVWEKLEPERREAGLHQLLGRLSHEQRQALILSATYGLEDGELADVLGLSIPTVRNMLAEGRDALQRSINQEEVWSQVQDSMDREFRDPRRRR